MAAVVGEWREALPGAEVGIFDNNSTDGTGDLARGLGVRVVEVPEQGKGHAVRAIFEALRDRDAVVLVDGDGTYPASHVGALLRPILRGEADMTVGARRPVQPQRRRHLMVSRGRQQLAQHLHGGVVRRCAIGCDEPELHEPRGDR